MLNKVKVVSKCKSTDVVEVGLEVGKDDKSVGIATGATGARVGNDEGLEVERTTGAVLGTEVGWVGALLGAEHDTITTTTCRVMLDWEEFIDLLT